MADGSADVSTGRVLARILAGAGVQAAYGRRVRGLRSVEVDDPAAAATLAAAHRAVHRVGAAVIEDDRNVAVVGTGTSRPETVVVTSPADLVELGRSIEGAVVSGAGLRVMLDIDPSTPFIGRTPEPPAADTWAQPDPSAVEALGAASSVAVLAGPGVVLAGAVPGLHAFATAGGMGVLNTWGAKGVFHWRSRHHLATVGLQEHDFSLGGLADADLVVAVGVDEREAPARLWADYPHVVVAPAELPPLAQAVSQAWAGRSWAGDPPMPPLRERLAAATQAGWSRDSVPIAPSRVTMHYGRRLAGGGLCAADAGGAAGFWVARTFGTTVLGGASVPAAVVPGWAVACVIVARLANPMRPALAVVDRDLDEPTRRLLELARTLGIRVGVEVWTDGGDRLDPADHLERLAALADPTDGGIATLATDPAQLDEMVAAAGPVRAWAD